MKNKLIFTGIILVIIIGIFFTAFDSDAAKIYFRTSHTGGGTGAADNINGASLSDGDSLIIITKQSDTTYPSQHLFYTLDADSAAAESVPDVISPDTNAGDKRWILTSPEAAGLGNFDIDELSNVCAITETEGDMLYYDADNSCWTVTDSIIHVDDTGKIGIGTTNPTARLEVEVEDNANVKGLLIDVDDVTNNPIAFEVHQAGTGDIINLFDGANEVFSVVDGGKVGIGIEPTQMLDVQSTMGIYNVVGDSYLYFTWGAGGDVNNAYIRAGGNLASLDIFYSDNIPIRFYPGITSGQNPYVSIFGHDTGAGAAKYGRFNIDADGDFVIEAESGEVIRLRTNSSDQVTIDNSGNVGIGAASPSAKLDVDGDISATGDITGGTIKTGRGATHTVCASDAYTTLGCDSQADGTNDEVEIQAAIDNCDYDSAHDDTCNIRLSEGNFSIGATINVHGNMVLSGSGNGVTELTVAAGTNPDFTITNITNASPPIFTVTAGHGLAENDAIWITGASTTHQVTVSGDSGEINNVVLYVRNLSGNDMEIWSYPYSGGNATSNTTVCNSDCGQISKVWDMIAWDASVQGQDEFAFTLKDMILEGNQANSNGYTGAFNSKANPTRAVTFTVGGTATPVVGDWLVGATSGAAGKIRTISTCDTGSWAGGDCTGSFTYTTSYDGAAEFTDTERLKLNNGAEVMTVTVPSVSYEYRLLDGTVKDVWMMRFGGHAITLGWGWGWRIENNVLEYSEGYGVWNFGTGNAKIVNNKILLNVLSAIRLDVGDNIIMGNELSAQKGSANPWYAPTSESALWIKSGGENVVIGNTISDTGATHDQAYGIRNTPNSTIFIGNQIRGATNGIRMVGAAVWLGNNVEDGVSMSTATDNHRIEGNIGMEKYQLVTATGTTLNRWGRKVNLDSSGAAVGGTQGRGLEDGQEVYIYMTDATNCGGGCTITITEWDKDTNNDDNDTCSFDAVDEHIRLIWDSANDKFITFDTTCTIAAD